MKKTLLITFLIVFSVCFKYGVIFAENNNLQDYSKIDAVTTATEEAKKFTLNVTIEGKGTITPELGGEYYEGSSIILRAISASGWQFSSWSGDFVSSSNPAKFSLTGNKSITATFIAGEGEKGDIVSNKYIDFEDLFEFADRWHTGDLNKGSADCSNITDVKFHRLIDLNDDCFIDSKDQYELPKYWHSGLKVIFPKGDENLSGVVNIIWQAKDPNGMSTGEDLTIEIFYSSDYGITWEVIASNEENDGKYEWDTTLLPSSYKSIIKITASNNQNNFNKTDQSDRFRITSQSSAILEEVKVATSNELFMKEKISTKLNILSSSQLSLDINILNLADLHNVNIDINYNSQLLEAVEVREGTLLKSFGETVFMSDIDNINGVVNLATAMVGTVAGVDSAGTIATIIYNKTGNVVESDFILSNITLRNSSNLEFDSNYNKNWETVEVDNSIDIDKNGRCFITLLNW